MKLKRVSRWLAGLVVLMTLLMAVPAQAATDPALTAGLQLWLRADAGAVSSGGKLLTWVDQSGNNNHAYPTTPYYQPTLVSGALHGLPVVRFNGGQTLMLSSLTSVQNFTIFIVGKNSQPDESFGMILGPGGGLNNQLRWEDSNRALIVGTGNDLSATTRWVGPTRVYHALAVRYDNGILSFYYNGNLQSSQVVSSSGPWTFGQIGGWYASYFLTGDIAEILVYDSGLSDYDRTNINSYLKLKYMLP